MSYRSKTYTWNDVILVKRSMIRVFLHDLMWISRGYVQEKFQISWHRRLQVCFCVYFLLPHHSLEKARFWNRQTFTERHWMNSWWYIWVLLCPILLLGNPCLNKRHHSEVAVICQLPPYQGHCQTAWNILCDSPMHWALMNGTCSMCVCSPALVLVT